MITQLIILNIIFVVILVVVVFFLFKASAKNNSAENLSLNEFVSKALPLTEKITQLQKQIEEKNQKDLIDKQSLQKEIGQLIELNRKINIEAGELSRALKGNIKTQGIWGEFILEKVLDSSGLREGIDYTLEGKDLKLKADDGSNLRPDVLVNLPDEKKIIIDSKCSLSSYELLINLDPAKEDYKNNYKELKDRFSNAIKAHIDIFDSKKYENIEQINSLLFKIMFIPVESMMSLISLEANQLIEYAWKKNIIIAGPSNLMGMLKISHSLWKNFDQEKNAALIALKAGKLYDKFALHYNELVKIQDQVKKLDQLVDKSLNQVQFGKGNLTDKALELKELGARTTKELN